MMGDHEVIGAFISLTKLVVPVAFYLMGTLVSLIQAFVFTLIEHDLCRLGRQLTAMTKSMDTTHSKHIIKKRWAAR